MVALKNILPLKGKCISKKKKENQKNLVKERRKCGWFRDKIFLVAHHLSKFHTKKGMLPDISQANGWEERLVESNG